MKYRSYYEEGLNEDSYLEIEYEYQGEGPQLSYDQPPDPASVDILKVTLWTLGKPAGLGGVPMEKLPPMRVAIDVTSWYETFVDEESVIQHLRTEAEES